MWQVPFQTLFLKKGEKGEIKIEVCRTSKNKYSKK